MIKILILLFSLTEAFAQTTIVVKGTIIAFDQKKITLQQPNAVVYVPRKYYQDLKKVKIGRTVIEVEMQPSEMLEYNPIFKTYKKNK